MLFDERLRDDLSKRREIAIESFENGQLLPSLETAQALSHLKVKIETNNDHLTTLYKEKKKTEKSVLLLENKETYYEQRNK